MGKQFSKHSQNDIELAVDDQALLFKNLDKMTILYPRIKYRNAETGVTLP